MQCPRHNPQIEKWSEKRIERDQILCQSLSTKRAQSVAHKKMHILEYSHNTNTNKTTTTETVHDLVGLVADGVAVLLHAELLLSSLPLRVHRLGLAEDGTRRQMDGNGTKDAGTDTDDNLCSLALGGSLGDHFTRFEGLGSREKQQK
jgi:hypothetical protein